jgi:hypothetical protein
MQLMLPYIIKYAFNHPVGQYRALIARGERSVTKCQT